jgi:hypothetical protein
MILLFCILDVFCPWSGVVDCYRSMRSFERLTLNVRSKIQDSYTIDTFSSDYDEYFDEFGILCDAHGA